MSKPSVLPAGMRLVGDIAGGDDLVVHGAIDGEVNLDGTVVIEATGEVHGNVKARSVVIRGVVVGDASATESVRVEVGGRVVGDVRAPRVNIVRGAKFRGRVQMWTDGKPSQSITHARPSRPRTEATRVVAATPSGPDATAARRGGGAPEVVGRAGVAAAAAPSRAAERVVPPPSLDPRPVPQTPPGAAMWSPAQADSLFSDPPTMRQDVVPVHRAEPTVARQPDTDGLGRDFDSPPSGEVTVPGYLPALDHGRPALNDAVQRQSATAGPRADVMPKGGVPLRDTVAGAPAPMETESAERPSRERRRPPPPRMPVLRRTRARRNLAH